ncbi:MAG: MFS transporter [Planctomycetaceae bacterium]|nr:MFS transporter [Planctomycetaceae bacterium]
MTDDLRLDVPTRRREVVFWLASATSFLLYLHRYTWNLIRPQLQEEYGFSNTTLEALGTSFYATYAFGSVPSGVVIDLFGAHLVLVVIVLVWSLVLPLHGVTGNIYGIGAVRLLFGAAQTGTYPALGQVTRTWFPRSSRTRVQGWVASFYGRTGGAMASVLMGTVLMGSMGLSWRAALFVLAVPGVLFALLFWVLFRNTPEEDPHTNEAERELIRGDERTGQEQRGVISTRQVLRNKSMRVMVVQQFMNAGADIAYTLVLGSFFLSLGVKDMKDLGWIVSLPLIGGAVGGIVGGYLNDWLIPRVGSRWGRSLVGISGKGLAALCLWGAISQPTPLRVSVGLMCVKFFTDWTQPTGWGTCTDIGGRFAATVFSIMNMAGNIGGLVMPLIFGPLLDYFTTEIQFEGELKMVTDFTPMFMIVGTLYVAAGFCWLFVDCTERVDVATV